MPSVKLRHRIGPKSGRLINLMTELALDYWRPLQELAQKGHENLQNSPRKLTWIKWRGSGEA